MPLLPSQSALEGIIEADHEETTTRHDDDFGLDDDDDDDYDISSGPRELTTNLEEITQVLLDGDKEGDEVDDDEDVLFYDNQYVNPGNPSHYFEPSSTATTADPTLRSSCTNSNTSTSSSSSNHSSSNLRSSSISSNSAAAGYLQSSTFLEPLVEGDDGDVSMEFQMNDTNNGHDGDEEEEGEGDDSGNAVEDMEYEDMYGGGRDMQDHHSTPRLSTFFNSIDRSGTPSTSTSGTMSPRNNHSRQSFVSTASSARRVSTETHNTNQSAPPVLMHTTSSNDGIDATDGTKTNPQQQQRRRVTIQADHNNNNKSSKNNYGSASSGIDGSQSNFGIASNSSLASRSSRFRISSRYGSSTYNSENPSNDRVTKSGLYGSIINRRRSTRGNQNNNGNGGASMYNSSGDSNSNTSSAMVDAVERLNKYQSSDFEYVSAAAAVVTATASGKRNYVQQFGQGDHVLVILAILGLADAFGNKEMYTVDPVNKLGFPRNEGKTEAQNQGPFLYVLCVVKQVHFDEDERYYTVLRCDTNTEQRADPGYMEPIRDGEVIELAYQASQRSRMSMANQHVPTTEHIGFCERGMKSLMQFGITMKRRFIPTYIRTRNGTKQMMQRLLHGEPGCALHFRFSGINFLVCCSLLFLFHDIFALGYLPASADFVMDTIGLYVSIS